MVERVWVVMTNDGLEVCIDTLRPWTVLSAQDIRIGLFGVTGYWSDFRELLKNGSGGVGAW